MKKKKRSSTGKRILAVIGIILILSMYLLTMVFALQKSEFAQAAFRGALGCTILVPVFLYIILMVARAVRPKRSAVIDGILFHEGHVLKEADGSDVYFRKEWEGALKRQGYHLYYFHEAERTLETYLRDLCSREKASRLLYVDTDPGMVKEAQRLGLPALCFEDAVSCAEAMDSLGIRL